MHKKEIHMQRFGLLVFTTLWAAAALADDGSILLHGRQAKVTGTTLRYEPQPHKQTLGCWTKADDAAEWAFTVSRPGDYRIEVLQGCGRGQGGSTMLLTVNADGASGQSLDFVVEETGHFQAFKPRAVGRVTLAAGAHTLQIKPQAIAKKACCDIRQVRLVPVAAAASPPVKRPNIIFVFSDDHAEHAISAYGSTVNTTPHLDRLAAGGARFTNSFVTNSICTPSRATLLTGQYSHQNGVPVFNRFDGSRDTVAKHLQQAGYHTGMIGKWHLGSTIQRSNPVGSLPRCHLPIMPVW